MPFRVDVFSRLMADRIVFLGTGVDDYVATSFRLNFYSESTAHQRIFRFTSTHQVEVFMLD